MLVAVENQTMLNLLSSGAGKPYSLMLMAVHCPYQCHPPEVEEGFELLP